MIENRILRPSLLQKQDYDQFATTPHWNLWFENEDIDQFKSILHRYGANSRPKPSNLLIIALMVCIQRGEKDMFFELCRMNGLKFDRLLRSRDIVFFACAYCQIHGSQGWVQIVTSALRYTTSLLVGEHLREMLRSDLLPDETKYHAFIFIAGKVHQRFIFHASEIHKLYLAIHTQSRGLQSKLEKYCKEEYDNPLCEALVAVFDE
jgi:hypothetical protein